MSLMTSQDQSHVAHRPKEEKKQLPNNLKVGIWRVQSGAVLFVSLGYIGW